MRYIRLFNTGLYFLFILSCTLALEPGLQRSLTSASFVSWDLALWCGVLMHIDIRLYCKKLGW